MYIIETNNSIAKIDIGSANISIGAILYIKDADAILEVRLIDIKYAVCVILTNARNITCNMKVSVLEDKLTLDFNASKMGYVLDPLLNVKYAGKCNQKKSQDVEICKKYNHKIFDNENFNTFGTIIGDLEIQETGIKVIDFFCPFILGGKTGIIGGAGTGKSTIILELINSLRQQGLLTVFSGVGERIREGFDLFNDIVTSGLIDPENPHMSDIVIIYGTMDQPAVVRECAARTSFNVAEILMNREQRNVLLVVDNIYRYIQAQNELSTSLGVMPSEMGYQPDLISSISKLQEKVYKRSFKETLKICATTSIQAIYVPEDDFTDIGVRACIKHMQSSIVLNRNLASDGIYPCVDPMLSESSAMDINVIGKQHYDAYIMVKRLLNEYINIKNIVSFTGEESLSEENKLIYNRGNKIYAFITQPFKTAEHFTGVKGVKVSLSDTINGFTNICLGKYDDCDSSDLYMKGKI